MVDTGRSGVQSTGGKNASEQRIPAGYTISAKPLDFSFLKITNVAGKYTH